MANQLKMAMVNAILLLERRGWSQRRIARELGIDRETVARYVHPREADPRPATNAPTVSEVSRPANAAIGSVGQDMSRGYKTQTNVSWWSLW
jgi:predicted transcriptional regulator